MLRSKKDFDNFVRNINKLNFYDVNAHGTLTSNLRTFTVPKNTAIVHLTMPGYSTIGKSRQNVHEAFMTNAERGRLLRGNASWKNSGQPAYSVVYVEGDTIPDLDLSYQCIFGRMGVYNVKSKKAVTNYAPSVPSGNDNNTTAKDTMLNLIKRQGQGVYFVVSCRPMHPTSRNVNRLSKLQATNLQARSRLYNTVHDTYYSTFMGAARNTGGVLSHILTAGHPKNLQLVRTIQANTIFLEIIHKLSSTMTIAALAYPTYQACSFFDLTFLAMPPMLFAVLIGQLLNMSHGHQVVYASATGLTKIKNAILRLKRQT